MTVAGVDRTWSSPLPAWHVYWPVSVTAAVRMTSELLSALKRRCDVVWKSMGTSSCRHSIVRLSCGSVTAAQSRTTTSPTFTVWLRGPATIRVGAVRTRHAHQHWRTVFIVCPMLWICTGHWQNIKSRKRPSVSPSVRPSGVCGQKRDVIHGPTFTKFGS